jgi:hypothetical protein
MKRNVNTLTIIVALILVKSEEKKQKVAIDVKTETKQHVTNFLQWEKDFQRKDPKFDFYRAPTVLRKLRQTGIFCLVTQFLDAKDFTSIASLNSKFYQKIRGTIARYRNHLNQNFINDFGKFFTQKFPEEQLVSTYFSIFCAYFGSNETTWTYGEHGILINATNADKMYVEDDVIVYEFAGGKRQKYENMYPLAVEADGIFMAAKFMHHFKVKMPELDWRTDVVKASLRDGVNLISQLTPQNLEKIKK